MSEVRNVLIAKMPTEAEAQAVAAARPDYCPAVTVGDAVRPGAPAHGYVERLRAVGRAVYADLTGLSDALAAALASRRCRIKAHVFHNVRRGKDLLRRALKCVTVEGVTADQLRLTPSGVVQFSDDPAQVVHVYAADDDGDDVGRAVDAAVRDHMRRTGEQSYSKALAAVLAQDRALQGRYASGFEDSGISRPGGFGREVERVPSQAETPIDRGEASARVHDLVVAWMEKHQGKDYTAGLTAILRAYPELAAQYRGIREAGPIWQPNQWEKDRM